MVSFTQVVELVVATFLNHASKDESNQRKFPDQATCCSPADAQFAALAVDYHLVCKPTLVTGHRKNKIG
jgi:hypothetical protein